jgi:hypothetical protein
MSSKSRFDTLLQALLINMHLFLRLFKTIVLCSNPETPEVNEPRQEATGGCSMDSLTSSFSFKFRSRLYPWIHLQFECNLPES